MDIGTIREYLNTGKVLKERCSWWVQYDIDDFHFDLDRRVVKIWSSGQNRYDDTDFAEVPLDIFLIVDTKQEAERVRDEWKKEAKKKRLEEEKRKKKEAEAAKVLAEKKKEEVEYALWLKLQGKYGGK